MSFDFRTRNTTKLFFNSAFSDNFYKVFVVTVNKLYTTLSIVHQMKLVTQLCPVGCNCSTKTENQQAC